MIIDRATADDPTPERRDQGRLLGAALLAVLGGAIVTSTLSRLVS